MNIHSNNSDYNLATLPLFRWGLEHQKKQLTFPAVYLAGKYHLTPIRAALISDLMGLEAANNN